MLMAVDPNKKKFHLWAYPDVLNKVKEMYVDAGCRSQSEFIEKAIRFYCAYLSTQDTDEYLPELIDNSLKSRVQNLEDKMCNQFFKNTVELSMLLHVFSALNNISEAQLDDLRATCVKEVRSLNGSISFKNALRYQRRR